ncbi:lipase family protein [Nitrosomonas sp. Nm33]|uniref:lipase family protein n=1 Tax=Nitrosomonas sp. Nm33 TaxID=133724 RepID=UPI00089639C8|nr:lipase family protein [Nitrosomonas sp. Nm33]SDY12978.1 Lipase (class 3) [Nitrosomonas sp. Nm33]
MSTISQSLPMYFPSSFVQTEAAVCGSLVLTAYDQYNQWADQGYPSQADFNWTPEGLGFQYSQLWGIVTVLDFPNPEPFGFVAWDGNGSAFVVFRGTMTKADGIIDAEIDQTSYALASGFGNVQMGWYKVYTTISPSLLKQLGQIGTVTRLFFAGHSMGAALSSLAVPDVAINSQLPPSSNLSYVHYNFASPRVGDTGFAVGMNFSVQAPTFRIVNTEDIVPDVPPPLTGSTIYQHIGTPVDFTAEYSTTDDNHSMASCYWYAINNPTQPQGPMPSSSLLHQIRVDGKASNFVPRTLVT